MNPFKQKEISLSTGYYFDIEKKLIVYLDVDSQSEDFGRQTLYSRESNKKEQSFNLMFLSMRNMSSKKDLYSLEILEDMGLNKSLTKDFDWICEDQNVKEDFLLFLKNNEFYNLLRLFSEYENNKLKEKKKTELVIDVESGYPKYKR